MDYYEARFNVRSTAEDLESCAHLNPLLGHLKCGIMIGR